jgi:hypothetical protein
MRSTNNETLCTSSTYSCVFHTDLKINSDYVSLELYMAVWLTTPFYWNMTPRHWVIESRNFENRSAFVFQSLVTSYI